VRLAAELCIIGLLVWLGWDKSFHAWSDQWRGIKPASPAPAQVNATAPSVPRQPFLPAYRRMLSSATPSGQWMWDPAHRSALDAPATKAGQAPGPTSAPDAAYWIDGRGVRHPINGSAPSP